MQTKLCPMCGSINPDEAEECQCGHVFGSEPVDPMQDLLQSSLAGLLGGGPLNVRALAIAAGIFWGGGIFVLTWWLILMDGVTGETLFLGRLYLGYSVSPLGSVIGLLWGLADGAISGAVLAWLYNVALLRVSSKSGKKKP